MNLNKYMPKLCKLINDNNGCSVPLIQLGLGLDYAPSRTLADCAQSIGLLKKCKGIFYKKTPAFYTDLSPEMTGALWYIYLDDDVSFFIREFSEKGYSDNFTFNRNNLRKNQRLAIEKLEKLHIISFYKNDCILCVTKNTFDLLTRIFEEADPVVYGFRDENDFFDKYQKDAENDGEDDDDRFFDDLFDDDDGDGEDSWKELEARRVSFWTKQLESLIDGADEKKDDKNEGRGKPLQKKHTVCGDFLLSTSCLSDFLRQIRTGLTSEQAAVLKAFRLYYVAPDEKNPSAVRDSAFSCIDALCNLVLYEAGRVPDGGILSDKYKAIKNLLMSVRRRMYAKETLPIDVSVKTLEALKFLTGNIACTKNDPRKEQTLFICDSLNRFIQTICIKRSVSPETLKYIKRLGNIK